MKRRILLTLILMTLCFGVLNGCGKTNKISGTYSNEDGSYSIDFTSDSECTWYQDGMFFNGTYKKTDTGYQIEIAGNGLYLNTVFTVDIDGNDLVVSGGKIEEVRFEKD